MNNYWQNGSGAYDPVLAKVIEKENQRENKTKKIYKTNFERITKNKKSLINFVMYEVLDLAGPHINHSIKKFKTHKRFSDWLDEEVGS